MSFEATALILAWLTLIVLAFAVAGLLRQVRWLLDRAMDPAPSRAGPAVGISVPEEQVPGDPTGRKLLLFVDSSCPSCRLAIAEVRKAWGELPVEIAIVVGGQRDGLDVGPLPAYEDKQPLLEQLRIPALPFAVVLEDAKVVRAEAVGAPEKIRTLLADEQKG